MKSNDMKARSLSIVLLFMSFSQFVIAQTFETQYFNFGDFSYIDGMNHGDFNGDGQVDFVLTASNFGDIMVGLNVDLQKPEFYEISTIKSIEHTVVVDFDQDGDMDIIGRTMWNGNHLFLNDGNANFETLPLDIPFYSSLIFTDITGDNNAEMLVSSFRDIFVYEIEGGTTNLTMIHEEQFESEEIDAMNVVDYDLDGDQDIILSYSNSGLMLIEQSAPLMFEKTQLFDSPIESEELEIVNLTDDGFADFVLIEKFDNEAQVLVSDTSGQYGIMPVNQGIGPTRLTLSGNLNETPEDEIIIFEAENFNSFGMFILAYEDGLTPIYETLDFFATDDGGLADLDNDGDQDFYFFTNDITSPGLVYFLNDGVSNVQNLNLAQVSIFPNPTSDQIHVYLSEQTEIQLNLLDMNGNLLKTENNSSLIQTNNLSSGTYLLEITDLKTNHRIVERIIVLP